MAAQVQSAFSLHFTDLQEMIPVHGKSWKQKRSSMKQMPCLEAVQEVIVENEALSPDAEDAQNVPPQGFLGDAAVQAQIQLLHNRLTFLQFF